MINHKDLQLSKLVTFAYKSPIKLIVQCMEMSLELWTFAKTFVHPKSKEKPTAGGQKERGRKLRIKTC